LNKRALSVGMLTAGMTVGLAASMISPASAQGLPVGGSGNTYYLQGNGVNSGQAAATVVFGNADDDVYFGQLDADDTSELPLVRRGNVYYVPVGFSGATQNAFTYGNPDDEVYLGDWDGDGVDTLAVRRGNLFLVKNDNLSTGSADFSFRYGDAGDEVYVGNFDGTLDAVEGEAGATDTIAVRRGNQFFVSNDLDNATGVADYDFSFGDAGDEVLVGDWATRAVPATNQNPGGTQAASGNGADQLMIVRGNTFFQSTELADADARNGNPETFDVFRFGNPTDQAFTASVPTDDAPIGDSVGVRR